MTDKSEAPVEQGLFDGETKTTVQREGNDDDVWETDCRDLLDALDALGTLLGQPRWAFESGGEIQTTITHRETGKVLFEGTVWPLGKKGSGYSDYRDEAVNDD